MLDLFASIFETWLYSHQINQLEKDKDVVAQSQAISTLEMLPNQSFSVVNALNNFLTDSKVIVRFRGILLLYFI